MPSAGHQLLILAHGASWDRRFQVSSLAASEIAADRDVAIALFFGALQAWVKGDWARLDPAPPVDPSRLDTLDLRPLDEMLHSGRDQGRLRLYACSASMRILDLDAAEVQARVDAILGWQSFSQLIRQAERVVTF